MLAGTSEQQIFLVFRTTMVGKLDFGVLEEKTRVWELVLAQPHKHHYRHYCHSHQCR